ncbi:glycosidase [Verrucomicrobiota bacterium]
MNKFSRTGKSRDVVHRWDGNPLIRLENLEFPCADLRSAGVVFRDNEIFLLVTIEHLEGYHSIHLARQDEKGAFCVDKTPFIAACRSDSGCSIHESRGVLDARVSFLDGVYYIMYLASGAYGFRLGLASTQDFKQVKSYGLISEPDTKAGTLFCEKIDGRYARLERPAQGKSIWISYSDDLIHWGSSEVLLSPRGGFWDSDRVGAGAPPMRIQEGWLLIYYGVKETSAGPLFRLGAAILDGDDPSIVLHRSNIPILGPREDYERIGDLHNIVFTTGAFIDGETVSIFYSGADSCVCMGRTTVGEIVETCLNSAREF